MDDVPLKVTVSGALPTAVEEDNTAVGGSGDGVAGAEGVPGVEPVSDQRRRAPELAGEGVA